MDRRIGKPRRLSAVAPTCKLFAQRGVAQDILTARVRACWNFSASL
jgi:hypothetical protein